MEILKLLLSALGGGVIAAFVTHWLAFNRENKRDREQRKREFRGYLAELRSRMERLPDRDDKVGEMFEEFLKLLHTFHRERAKVACDFEPVEEFRKLCDKLGRLRYHEILVNPGRKEPRAVIADAIDELIEFTSETGGEGKSL
jgi:hypothetical protein